MIGKKGQGMSTSTIVLLILGLIILVALIWGFATGWEGFRSIVSPSNVDDIVRDCNLACTTDAKYSFCSAERTLRANEDSLEVKSTCFDFSTNSEYEKYGIAECSRIDCS